MSKTVKSLTTRTGRVLALPTPAEEAAINAGIAADADACEVSDADFSQLRRPGRPRVAVKRPMLSMRTDPDVLAALRASGPGWQTRVNALLREAVGKGRI